MHGTKRDRNEWLDVLRGLAILGVVSVHSIALTDSLNLSYKSTFLTGILDSGKYGVELFFFLSGWLLASIYGIKSEEALGRSYWFRRFARIYPLWLIFLGVTWFRWQWNGSGPFKSIYLNANDHSSFFLNPAVIFLLSLTFTLFLSASLWNSVIPGGWSIQAEIAHYLLFPLLRKKKLNSIVFTVAMVNLTTVVLYIWKREALPRESLLWHVLESWFRLGLTSTLSFFIIGMLSFSVYSFVGSSESATDFFQSKNLSPLVCLGFLTSALIVPTPFGTQIEAMGYLIASLVIGSCVLQSRKWSLFLRALGKYSYFMYFMHFLVLDGLRSLLRNLDFTDEFFGSQPIFFLCVLSFTLFVSFIFAIPSFKLIEQPIIRFAHRF
jgi:peptidoglycan/LPS O-acetylase OafA/YrhL